MKKILTSILAAGTFGAFGQGLINLDNYLFGLTSSDLSPEEREEISRRLRREMLEIFYGRNMQ